MSLSRRLAALDERVLPRWQSPRYGAVSGALTVAAMAAIMTDHPTVAGPFLGSIATLAVLDVMERRKS